MQLKRYGFAAVVVIIAIAVELVFIDIFERYPFYIFWPLMVVIGWYIGLGPGLFASVLAVALVNYFILPPRYSFVVGTIELLLLFVFASVVTFLSWLRQRERRSEQVINQQQREMQITLASIGDGVIVTDARGKVTYLNEIAVMLTGWQPEDAAGRDITEVFNIVNEGTRQPAETPVMAAIEQGVVVGLANHTLLLSKTGEEWPISDSGAPIRSADGEIMGAVLVFRDVSESRERERALEASEARYRQLVDNATDIIYTLDMQGNITSINPAAETITGYSQAELMAMSLADLVAPESMAHTRQMLERKLDGEEKTVYELEIITKNRQRRTLEVNSQLSRDNGQAAGIEGIARDVTIRKGAEQRSRTLHSISAGLARTITLAEVASVIIDEILTLLGAHHGAVGLVTDDGQNIELLRLTNMSDEQFEQYRLTPLSVAGPMTDAVRTATPVWIESQAEYVERYPLYKDVVQQQTRTQAAAALPLRLRSHVIGSVMFSFREARELSADDKTFLETIADYCAQSIDRARLYEDTQQARAALQTRVLQQSVVAEIGQQALTSHDLAGLMETTALQVASTLNVEIVKFLELVEGENHLLLKAGVGWDEALIGMATVSADATSIAGYTIASSEPVIIENLQTETRFHGSELLLEHGVISGMSVLIQGHRKPFGVFGVHSTQKRVFTQDDIYFLQSVANVIGAAVENAELTEQARAAAALEERQRLARELHDSVTQSMFAATSRAEIVPRLWERDQAVGLEQLQQVIMLNRGAMAEMRALLLELRPEAILNNSLETLYQQLIDAAQARVEIKGTLAVQGEAQQLPPDVHLAFYRIVQESINNVVKHSQSKTFQLELVYDTDEIRATVTDNGRGYEPDNVQVGLGTGSMHERAHVIGATLTIESQLGQGTTVLLCWSPASV